MIQQAENEQDKKDDVVSEEVKPREESAIDRLEALIIRVFGNPKQKGQMIYTSIIFFVLGVLFSFAPTYMQTNISWIINASGILCLTCWGISFFYIRAVYPNIHKNFEIFLLICLSCAIIFYSLSEATTKIPINPLDRVSYRGYSFFLLLLAVMTFMMRVPDYIDFYSKHKGKIKAFFTAKHTAALVLGILSVGTALFQFIQVVLQIFHL